jgi:hypothetical protein
MKCSARHVAASSRVHAGLDGAGKTTILSHVHPPYQLYPTPYTNSLLAEQQPKPRSTAADPNKEARSPEEKTADEAKAADGKEKKADGGAKPVAAAIVATPDLVPFNDVILPTSGVQLSEFTHKGQHVRAWDLSGQGKFRPLWEEYYPKVRCLSPFVRLSLLPSSVLRLKHRAKKICALWPMSTQSGGGQSIPPPAPSHHNALFALAGGGHHFRRRRCRQEADRHCAARV